MHQRQLLAVLASVGLAAGCLISTDDFAGKPCSSDSDCPSAFYSCLVTRADGYKACEVIFPPRAVPRDGGTTDGGGPVQSGPTYCGEVKDILDRTCVANCHGAEFIGSGNPNFRLDYYTSTTVTLPGAKAYAARVKARTSVDPKDMPPVGSVMPTDAERELVAKWVDDGAPEGDPNSGFCGTPQNSCLDGGTISFKNDLLPAWIGLCNPCHTSQNQGQLHLGNFDGGTYQDLMRPTVRACAAAPQRVAPNNPNGSSMMVRVSGNTCGPRMPENMAGVTLPVCDMMKLEAWIKAGAPNN